MNVVFPDEYSKIDITPDGYILTKDNRMWKEDFNGKVTNPHMFEYTGNMSYIIGYNNDGDGIYKLSDTYKYYYVNEHYGL